MKQIAFLLGGGYTEKVKSQYNTQNKKKPKQKLPALLRKDYPDTPKNPTK